jgi:hypothetical protein
MEFVMLLFGLMLGIIFTYFFFWKRIEMMAIVGARELSAFMFEQQKAQLEQQSFISFSAAS